MTKLARIRSGRQQTSDISFSRLLLHALFCIASFLLGFRLSRSSLDLSLVSFKPPEQGFLSRIHGDGSEVALRFPYVKGAGRSSGQPPSGRKSSSVHVGRHEILVRPWPHPDPVQTVVAHHLMDVVQREQRRVYGSKEKRQLIVITPTYVRTFQAVHLTCLMHTLRIVPTPLIWIVVEAGGASNETASLLSRSQLTFHHLGFEEAMPAAWQERQQLETRLRIVGLRFVREHKLDGIVLFADDSNTHSLEFFDEVQKVNWLGTFSIGVLSHNGLPGSLDAASEVKDDLHLAGRKESALSIPALPLQGPSCQSTGNIIGWYVPYEDEIGVDSQELRPNRGLQWAGFALNSRWLWEDYEKPTGIRSWNEIQGSRTTVLSPLDFVKNASLVEPLGNCGRDVSIWWLRVEARADSKFPSRWLIDPSLEIVVPSKHTPWPDPPAGHPPPPPILLPSDLTNERAKHRPKQRAKGGRGKRAVKKKQGLTHGDTDVKQASQLLRDSTEA